MSLPRAEAGRKGRFLTVAFWLIVMVALAMTITYIDHLAAAEQRAWEALGVETEATVTGLAVKTGYEGRTKQAYSGDKTHYFVVTYRYLDEKGTPHQGRVERRDLPEGVKIGSRIMVQFRRDDSSKSRYGR